MLRWELVSEVQSDLRTDNLYHLYYVKNVAGNESDNLHSTSESKITRAYNFSKYK